MATLGGIDFPPFKYGYCSEGSADDPAAHRQIWLSPYVKGPEGAPFVVKPRAWEFTR